MEDYPATLVEFEARFGTEEACRDYLFALRWPDGFCCPRCGQDRAWPVGEVLYQCAACDYKTSVTAGTIFQDTHKPLTLWFRALWWVTSQKNGASALGLQRVLGLGSYKTAWSWLHKLRRAMVRPGRERLSGRVEDYMVWTINEYIRRGLIDGIYIDDVSVGRTFSLAGTAYPWTGDKNGRRQGYTFMGFRRFCQRVWKLLDAQGKQPHLVAHMTYCFEIPALSFCMAAVNGEARMIGLGAKHDTMDAWRRDELRIMGNGPKWQGFSSTS